MQKILSKVFAIPDEPMGMEPLKVIAFALTMWAMILVVIFMVAPHLLGFAVTKPMLSRAFTLMMLPLMFATGMAGIASKSQSFAVLLIRAFILSLALSCIASVYLMVD